jgi:carbon-monoxide dehydrogenase large subunit
MTGIAGFDGAHVTLTEDGGATVWTTLPDIGQGSMTTFAQVVADQLAIEPDKVRIARSDTSVGALHGTGTFASRSAIAGGGALTEANGELRRRLLEDAADKLEIAPDDLRIEQGVVTVAGSPKHVLPIAELVRNAPQPDRYRVSAMFDPPALAYPYATHACEVEVDPCTGAVSITRYVIVEDCGTVINPLIVEGQVHGATAQGIGGTMMEELVYDAGGQLVTASLMDYLLPTASEVPHFHVEHLAIPAPESALGAKGVGEGGTLGPPGAVANAVSDALETEFNALPLRPERLAEAAAAVIAGGLKAG